MQKTQSKRNLQQSQAGKPGNAPGAGKQGGTHEQHVQAGSQSHKNSPGADKSTRTSKQPANSGGSAKPSASKK